MDVKRAVDERAYHAWNRMHVFCGHHRLSCSWVSVDSRSAVSKELHYTVYRAKHPHGTSPCFESFCNGIVVIVKNRFPVMILLRRRLPPIRLCTEKSRQAPIQVKG